MKKLIHEISDNNQPWQIKKALIECLFSFTTKQNFDIIKKTEDKLMKLEKALEKHLDFNKKSKIISYFGQSLVVPKKTIAVATDKNGFINFYQNSIPEIDHGIWWSDTEQEPEGILVKNKNNSVSIDDWKESLVIL